jgi:hypothetical protein
VLRLQNLRHLLLNRAPRRLPPKNLARPLRLTPRVQPPANSLKPSLVKSSVLLQSLLLRVLQVTELDSLLADFPREIAPDVLAALGQSVALGAPELGVGVACDGGFDEQHVDVGQVGDVDVVPAGLAGPDDGDVLAGEDELGELVDLAAAGVDGAAAVSWSVLEYVNVDDKTASAYRRW